MPKDRRILLILALVVVFVIWMNWWASWGFPLEYPICGKGENAVANCPSRNILLFSVWRLAELLDPWGVLITAIATGAVAYFTWVIKGINLSQLERSQEVERAYVSGGGLKQVTQFIPEDLAVGPPANASFLQRPDGSSVPVVETGYFELHINNHGKTPARLHHAQVGFCDAAAPPPEPPYESIFPQFDNIGPGAQSQVLRLIGIPQGRFSRIAVCGRFYWADIWDREWSSGFIYEIPGPAALPNGSLSIEAPAAYTKDRPEQPRAYP
jgi:hypothetical protein